MERAGEIQTAIATICCDGFGDEDFTYAFDHIPGLGVSNVEFNCWYPRNLTPAGIESIRRRSGDAGLRPVSLHLPALHGGDRADLTREVTRWMWLIHASTQLGVRVLKSTGSPRDTAGGLPAVIDILQAVAPIAADHGITIALENHFGNVLEFPQDYEKIFDVVDQENVGLCLDTGHFAASDVDMLQIIDQFHSKLVHIDLKDTATSGRNTFVPFGDGIVDFYAVLDHAVASGYSGYLLVEFPRRDLTSMVDDLHMGITIARTYERTLA